MTPVSGKLENTLAQVMESIGFDEKGSSRKLLKNTSLYSVYLISKEENFHTKTAVVLIEHLPAKEPSAHLLQIKTRESASKAEVLKEITAAVQEHFAQNDGASL